ncbi:hypothetical protein [Actinocorallia longicatena]|uniref:Uncharacterized protein n=1 Tax=Actinocorallia longicatena TaxID=111803 RepID=A0ABP6QDJ4_9ACTN
MADAAGVPAVARELPLLQRTADAGATVQQKAAESAMVTARPDNRLRMIMSLVRLEVGWKTLPTPMNLAIDKIHDTAISVDCLTVVFEKAR